MSQLPVAAKQYAAVTPSDSVPIANGPAQRFYCTGGTTMSLLSGDGSAIAITVAANTWTPLFNYPIAFVKATGTSATGIVAEGWGAPTTSGVAP